jgi:hypothetical protein
VHCFECAFFVTPNAHPMGSDLVLYKMGRSSTPRWGMSHCKTTTSFPVILCFTRWGVTMGVTARRRWAFTQTVKWLVQQGKEKTVWMPIHSANSGAILLVIMKTCLRSPYSVKICVQPRTVTKCLWIGVQRTVSSRSIISSFVIIPPSQLRHVEV